MRDIDQLRDLARQVQQPGFDALVETGRRRDRRRTAATLVGGAAAIVLAIGGGLLVSTAGDRAAPPVQEPTVTPTPSPTPDRTPTISSKRKSMTPKQVVNDAAARPVLTAAALGDPDVRFALWEAPCKECPRPPEQRGPTMFLGVALTTDGYRTTKYHRAGFPLRHGLPVRVTSPTDDTFLFADSSNSGSWLLRMDGTFTSVRRTEIPIATSHPRRSFECYSRRSPAVYTTNWCVLDPTTATSYEMPLSWQYSEVPPGTGEQPWGLVHDGESSPDQAWFDDTGARRTASLGPSPVTAVRGTPGGGPLYWRHSRSSGTLDLLDARRRSTPVKVTTRDAPQMTPYIQLARTPDGALLAWTTWPRVTIWRADGLSQGDFEQVHRAEPGSPEAGDAEVLGILGERMQIEGYPGNLLESTDDGRTWTEISTWR